jgi:monomeric isocitrate dehydrogenase
MKDFLNRYTAVNRTLQLHDEVTLRGTFEKTISLIRKELGQKAFRLKTAINAAILDAVMVGVSRRLSSSVPVTDLDSLRAAYDSLLKDEKFLNATGSATADEEYVRTRLDLAIRAMNSVR